MGQKPHHIQIQLSHPPDTVFAAWTDPAKLTRWLAEYAAVSLERDQYRLWGRHTPGGDSQPDGKAASLSLKENASLSFDWHMPGGASSVTIKFIPKENGTLLILNHTDIPKGFPFWMEDVWLLALENLRRFLDGKTTMTFDFSKPVGEEIRHEVEIDTPAGTVFDALINPEKINRWIAPDAKVDPVVGGEYDYGWGEGGPSKILALVPDKKLSHTWDAWGDQPATIVTWTLEESGGKTRLTLVHSGFGEDGDPSGENLGWLNFMGWIKSLCEYGGTWRPPVVKLDPGIMDYYAESIRSAQDQVS